MALYKFAVVFVFLNRLLVINYLHLHWTL